MAYELKDKDGEVVKKEDESVLVTNTPAISKAVDLKRRTMVMIGSDESIDRDGDIIRVAGWQLENYAKNPVFLWGHQYSSVPLARAVKVVRRRKPDPILEFHLKFPSEGIYPLADMVLSLYGQDVIRASSVGFIPKKWNNREEPQDGEDVDAFKRFWSPREFLKQELLELSGVSVPSNPNALQNALKGITLPVSVIDIGNGAELGIEEELLAPEKGDEILEELNNKIAGIVDEDEPTIHQVQGDIVNIEDLPEDALIQKEGARIRSMEKPLANEHSCRLKDPSGFDKFARKNCHQKHDGKCIDVIFGIKDKKSSIQALRYPKKVWTSSSARSHCKSRNGTFEPAATNDAYDDIVDELTNDFKVLIGEIGTLIERVDQIADDLESLAETVSEQAKTNAPDPENIISSILSQNDNGGEVATPAILEDGTLEKHVDSLLLVCRTLKSNLGGKHK